jgi:hypothetical protein
MAGTYADLADKKNQLIRKALTGSVFIAPPSVANLASLTSGSGAALVTLPTGWKDLGWVTKDGVGYGRETEQSEVTSFGSQQPTRTDQVSDVLSMTVVAQETSLLTLGLYIGVDTTGITAAATTGELRIAKPNIAANYHYRVLGLFIDEIEEGEIYMARYFPYAKITERGEQNMSDGDDPVTYSLTFRAEEDSDTGTDAEWLFAGPGWKALLADMGITQAS